MKSTAPLVSVIIPTYNWSSVLHYAIQSVLWQTFADFELIVIGDGCTDDSAEVVAAFDDPRIRWRNLPENSGSYAIPNNTGISMARGRYIAYQGHDDLWYPTHLEGLVAVIQRTDADFVHALAVRIGPPESGVRAITRSRHEGKFLPRPQSAMMHKRDVIDRIGGWNAPNTLNVVPELDFVRRALALRVELVDKLTVFRFPATWRVGSYVEQASHEQAEYSRRMMEEADFLQNEHLAVDAALRANKTTITFSDTSKPHLKPRGWGAENFRRRRGLEARSLPRPRLGDYLRFIRDAFKYYRYEARIWLRRLLRR